MKSMLCGVILVAAAVAPLIADAKSSFCIAHDTANKVLTVHFRTGCRSSTPRYLGDDIAVTVDQNYAFMQISGDFNYEDHKGPVTKDCGGKKSKSIKIEQAEARRYNVVYEQQYLGAVDFSSGLTGNACLTPKQAGYADAPRAVIPWRPSATTGAKTNSRWFLLDSDHWSSLRASTPMRLMLAYLGDGGDEDATGYTAIRFFPARGSRANSQNKGAMRKLSQVEFVQYGLADDSVSAIRIAGHVQVKDRQWQFRSLFRSQLCARGGGAGQWTSKPCP